MEKIDEIIEEFEKEFVNHGEFIYNKGSLPATCREIKSFLRQALTNYKEETLKLIKEEITWANIEGDKTSRLTSLFNKIN